MSVEFCHTCGNRVDTDHNVEGRYVAGQYQCERCRDKEAQQCREQVDVWMAKARLAARSDQHLWASKYAREARNWNHAMLRAMNN